MSALLRQLQLRQLRHQGPRHRTHRRGTRGTHGARTRRIDGEAAKGPRWAKLGPNSTGFQLVWTILDLSHLVSINPWDIMAYHGILLDPKANHDLSAFMCLLYPFLADVHCRAHGTQCTLWKRWNLRNPLAKLPTASQQTVLSESETHATRRPNTERPPEMVTHTSGWRPRRQMLQTSFMWPENHSTSAH